MSNLISELGVGYANDFLHGACFLYEDRAHIFNRVSDSVSAAVEAVALGGTPDKVSDEMTTIPMKFFTGWGAFSYPPLGYRTLADGKLLCYLSRNNTTRRGLSHRDVRFTWHDSAYQTSIDLGITMSHFQQQYPISLAIMKPQYVSFAEGMKKIEAGDVPAFALSADFAVAPRDGVEYLEILYRRRTVGNIDAKGKITITAPSAQLSWDSVSKEK